MTREKFANCRTVNWKLVRKGDDVTVSIDGVTKAKTTLAVGAYR